MKQFLTSIFQKHIKWTAPLVIAIGVLLYGVSEKGWDNTFINGDGKGYYAYLPAVFIYHNLSFSFIEKYEKEHYQPGQYCDFRQPVKGGVVNRYYIGTAVAQLPFFLITHLSCKTLGLDADGYSRPYQYTVLFAACFYLFIGLWSLWSLLSNFFKKRINLFILICLTFATPLLFYTVFNPDFSHIYSFAFISLFVNLCYQYFKSTQKKLIPLLFFILAIVTLIRPVNIIIILAVPFLSGNWSSLVQGISAGLKNYYSIIGGLAIFIAIIFIQLLVYRLQTQSFLVYSYGEAGFDFLHPNFVKFLFSYRKGLFVYTPLLFICMGGFFYLYKESRYQFFTLLLFLLAVIYALSAWSVWSYGMTYGQRPFIEYYFLFAILLGYLLSFGKNKVFSGIIFFLVLLSIPLNLIQMSQHRHYILHWDDMTKEKYWKVFLRTDPVYYGYLWNPVSPILDNSAEYTREISPIKQLPYNITLDPNQTKGITFSPGSSKDSLRCVLSLKVLPQSDKLKKNSILVLVRQVHKPYSDDYNFEINLRNLNYQKWNDIQKQINIPASSMDTFAVSFLNKGKYKFNIKEVKILVKPDN